MKIIPLTFPLSPLGRGRGEGKMVIYLMVVIPAAGAFLRPLPFIIFPPNFEPNRWIGHIDQTEKKAAQMGEMSDAAPYPRTG